MSISDHLEQFEQPLPQWGRMNWLRSRSIGGVSLFIQRTRTYYARRSKRREAYGKSEGPKGRRQFGNSRGKRRGALLQPRLPQRDNG